MTLDIADVEKIQALYPDYKIELRNGAITLMSPSDVTSALVGGRFLSLLGNWIVPRKLGYVFDSSAGFYSPSEDLTSPDVSFVSRARMPRVPRTYARVVPNLVVEVKSSQDRLKLLVEKLEFYLESGVEVAILVDPDSQTVTVSRSARIPEVLGNGDMLVLPELLPGWELAVSDLWPEVFEENA